MNEIKRKRTAGFTLIDVSVIFIIISIMAVPLAQRYSNFLDERKKSTFDGRFNSISDEMKLFSIRQAPVRYPFPANFLLLDDDPLSGVELASAAAFPNCTGWPTAAGVCRVVNPDGDVLTEDDVLIGAVPYATIGVDVKDSYDPYGRKFLYAVSEKQTRDYLPTDGAVRVFVADPLTGLLPAVPTIQDMVVISLGENGEGGYTNAGVLTSACDADPAGVAERENENCDMDAFFIDDENVVSHVNGANFYDDKMFRQARIPLDIWANNIRDADYVFSQAAGLGFGVDNPASDVHVMGNVKSSSLLVDRICQEDALNVVNCFDPRVIGGTTRCSNSAVGGLDEDSAGCRGPVRPAAPGASGSPINSGDLPVVLPGFQRRNCLETLVDGVPMILSGFDSATGEVKCRSQAGAGP